MAATGPARESARQRFCVGSLHQWGIAASMYRADWDGADPVAGQPMSYSQLGLPGGAEFSNFADTYLSDKSLRICPDYHGIIPVDRLFNSYVWVPAPDSDPGPPFGAMVARPGANTIISFDDQHNPWTQATGNIRTVWALPGVAAAGCTRR